MIVIVQNSNGKEVFRFNEDRPDGDTAGPTDIATALERALSGVTTVKPTKCGHDGK